MKIYHSVEEIVTKEDSSVVTIGTFDGVHLGHRQIIKNLVESARKMQSKAVILTFFPHPRMVLQKNQSLKLLSTLDEKTELLQQLGLDCLVIQPFTKKFSRLTALEFVKDILVQKLHVKKLIIGYDHQFGRNREGNFEQLEEFAPIYGFEVEEIPVRDIENIAISSTKIREALQQGNIEKANNFLGYPYSLTGKVVHGRGLGKEWHYPTINIHIAEDYKLIPKSGVYIIRTTIDTKVIYGIMNIGFRPTVDGREQTIEAHLLDFQGDLYEKTNQVALLYRLRDEHKFDSVNTLFEQIKKDESTARDIIKNKF